MREKLIESTINLLYSGSYGSVGVQEICELAGARKGSFYHFFPSKRDLTLATLDELQRRGFMDIFDHAFDPALPPLVRVEKLFDVLYRFQKEKQATHGQVLGCFFGNLAQEMSIQDDVLRERLLRIFRLAERRIAGVLSEAKARGDAPELDVRAAARALLSFIEGTLLLAKTRNQLDMLRGLGPAGVALVLSFRESKGGTVVE